jgi:hypothetical protein
VSRGDPRLLGPHGDQRVHPRGAQRGHRARAQPHEAISSATARKVTDPAAHAEQQPLSSRAATIDPTSPHPMPMPSMTPPSARTIRITRAGSAPRLIRMPISAVRWVMKNASTPPIPIAAMTSATTPNAPTSNALSRCGAMVCSRICSKVATRSMGWSGTSSRTTWAAWGPSVAAAGARMMKPPGKNAMSF